MSAVQHTSSWLAQIGSYESLNTQNNTICSHQ